MTLELTIICPPEIYQDVVSTVWRLNGFVRARGTQLDIRADSTDFQNVSNAVNDLLRSSRAGQVSDA